MHPLCACAQIGDAQTDPTKSVNRNIALSRQRKPFKHLINVPCIYKKGGRGANCFRIPSFELMLRQHHQNHLSPKKRTRPPHTMHRMRHVSKQQRGNQVPRSLV